MSLKDDQTRRGRTQRSVFRNISELVCRLPITDGQERRGYVRIVALTKATKKTGLTTVESADHIWIVQRPLAD